MKFIDEANITVQSGNGGSGCVSFRRERFIPKGGPDGGDGGKGGDIIFVANSRKNTLQHFRYQRIFKAPRGANGQGSQKTGKSGEDILIEVPTGTIITHEETGELIKDFTEDGERMVIAKGGRGGQGNMKFKSATHRAPRFAQPGEPGETLQLKLELKLLADVGLIGFPNAGKSTLISTLSAARPKIADYPFTTLTPNLGVVQTSWGEPFVVADIPGLIEGAHTGAGLGIQFLKHIERTRILIHLLDASEMDPDYPLSRYNAINEELTRYSDTLPQKPQLLVFNKMDLPEAEVAVELFQMTAPDMEFLPISAATGQGIDALKSRIVQLLESLKDKDLTDKE